MWRIKLRGLRKSIKDAKFNLDSALMRQQVKNYLKKYIPILSAQSFNSSSRLFMEGLEAFLPPHHKASKTLFGSRFDNPWSTWEERTFSDVLKWTRERHKSGIPTGGYLSYCRSPTAEDWAAAFPLAVPDVQALESPATNAVQALWIGHATVLVQLEGLTFLTDPVFEDRCSPLPFLGPGRVVAPALDLSDLPTVDAVLISHNHYDHLCKRSIRKLHSRFGNKLRFYVPLGLARWFHKLDITNVVELDWWEEVEHIPNVRIIFTPAQHWSIRKPWDRKATLWGGWAICASTSFWFAGDTGYAPVFKEIGERLGPFDLAAIPTGAYSPRWFMKPQHVDPIEAVMIHQDVQSKRSIAIHCLCFPLTDEPMDEPISLLEEAVDEAGLSKDSFVTLKIGGMIATVDGRDLRYPDLLSPPLSPQHV